MMGLNEITYSAAVNSNTFIVFVLPDDQKKTHTKKRCECSGVIRFKVSYYYSYFVQSSISLSPNPLPQYQQEGRFNGAYLNRDVK